MFVKKIVQIAHVIGHVLTLGFLLQGEGIKAGVVNQAMNIFVEHGPSMDVLMSIVKAI